MRSTKSFLSKQEEKILDLTNLPTTNQLDPTTLELKFQKIKKLKEEFNEIKS